MFSSFEEMQKHFRAYQTHPEKYQDQHQCAVVRDGSKKPSADQDSNLNPDGQITAVAR